MGKILYSIVEKSNQEQYTKFIRKYKRATGIIDLESEADAYIFAIDEETGRIVNVITLNKTKEQAISVNYNPLNYEKGDKNLINMFKIAINYAQRKNLNLDCLCQDWWLLKELETFGLEIDEEAKKQLMEMRNKYEEYLKDAKKELNSPEPRERERAKNRCDYLTKRMESIWSHPYLQKEKNTKLFSVEGFKDISELPEEYITPNPIIVNDPLIFKEDDKYLYGEVMRDRDQEYEDLIFIMADEITTPNLIRNGGTLMAYLGLTYPNLIIYMKDKEKGEIVGYIGLTTGYRDGLYVTQIAVKEAYKHRGIGTLLVEEAIRRANKENIDVVSVEIRPDNEKSIALFNKLGFNQVKPGYYTIDVKEYIKKKQDEPGYSEEPRSGGPRVGH